MHLYFCVLLRPSSSGGGADSTVLVRKPVSQHSHRWREPQLHWAAERYFIDLSSLPQTCKPLEETEVGRAEEAVAGEETMGRVATKLVTKSPH